jgi:hypothetical protein
VLVEAFSISGREYRLSRHALEIGLVAVVLFGVMGVASVTAALLNSDGSFRFPVAAAIIFGGFWSCMVLLGVWLILSYSRHRLFVDSTTVRVTGCFTTRQVRLANLTNATWKSFIKHGTLVLKEHSSIVKIGFGNYTYEERLELIHFFREALAGREQDGWEQFESRCMPPQVDYKELRSQMQGHLRFAAIAFAAAIPLMYAILIWLKLADGLPNGNWVVVAILPLAISGAILGMMWLAARGDLARAKNRDEFS